MFTEPILNYYAIDGDLCYMPFNNSTAMLYDNSVATPARFTAFVVADLSLGPAAGHHRLGGATCTVALLILAARGQR